MAIDLPAAARLPLSSTYRSLAMAQPTRPLIGARPHRYVRADHTDIRRTFRRARLLAYLQARRPAAGGTAAASAQRA